MATAGVDEVRVHEVKVAERRRGVKFSAFSSTFYNVAYALIVLHLLETTHKYSYTC